MNGTDIEIGSATLVADFLEKIDAAPDAFRELVLVSPFVGRLEEVRETGGRICDLIRRVRLSGGAARLISDDIPTRRVEFGEAIRNHRDMEGALFLCPKLHAKCGLALNKTGHLFAFLGSANLTNAGLRRNEEVVIGFQGRATKGVGLQFIGQLRQQIERIVSRSEELQRSRWKTNVGNNTKGDSA